MDVSAWIVENWQLVLLAVLVLDKVVAATPCKWDDLLLTGLKAGIAKLTGRTIGCLLMLVMCSGLAACGGVHNAKTGEALESHELAMLACDQMKDRLIDLRASYEAVHGATLAENPERAALMQRKVAPALNRAKDAVVLFRRAVAVWARTGTEPDNVEALRKSATDLVADAVAVVAELAAGKGD